MRILVTNAYSGQNKGDAAIVAGMLRDLRSHNLFKQADIRISSVDYPADQHMYKCTVVGSFHSLKNALSRNPHLGCLFFILILLPASCLWAIWWRLTSRKIGAPKELCRVLMEYAEADVIIAAGGGYLYTNSPVFGNVVLLITIWSFYFGVVLGKPVYLYSQSVGPFSHRCQEWLVKRALRKVRLVEVREESSRLLLESWQVQTTVHETVDAAFLGEEAATVTNDLLEETGLRVGMTVRKWFRDRYRQMRYEAAMRDFIDWLIGETNASVVFVPQVTFKRGDDDDRLAARDLCRDMRSGGRFQLITAELSPEEIRWLCGRMDFFVGTRMHSNIFALTMHVPTLAIEYQPKTRGIMKQLGMEEFTLSIDEIEINELKAKFRLLMESGDSIRSTLAQKIPELRRKVYHNGQIIEDDYRLFIRKERGRKGLVDFSAPSSAN